MLHLFEETIPFARKVGGPNTARRSISIQRPNATTNARVLLAVTGFDIGYDSEDHHLSRVYLRPQLDEYGPFGDSVDVRVDFGFRDSSGNWDDAYSGSVKLGVLVVDDPDMDVASDLNGTFPNDSGYGPLVQTTFHQPQVANRVNSPFLRGFDVAYSGSDHHVKEISAQVLPKVVPNGPTSYDAIESRLGLRDSSGNWDDAYGGTVDFSVLRYTTDVLTAFPSSVSVSGKGSGPSSTVSTFYSPVDVPAEDVFVLMTGFRVAFPGDDHHIYRMISKLEKNVRKETGKTLIDVTYAGGLRDSSGNWDDAYEASANFVVLIRNPETPSNAPHGVHIVTQRGASRWIQPTWLKLLKRRTR